MINNLTKDDELFIKCLMADITKNLCECECDCKDKECSIFERMFIARQLLETELLETKDTFYYKKDDNYIPIETLSNEENGTFADGKLYALSETETNSDYTFNIGGDTWVGNSLKDKIYKKSGDTYEEVYSLYGFNTDLETYEITLGSCIDWDTISARINNNYEQKNKFIDPSRKKLLSGFYMDIHGISDLTVSNSDNNFTLNVYLLGENSEYVIANCLDECCN